MTLLRGALLALLFGLGGCSSAAPLPSGPPPEYEPARSYDAGTNIDELGAMDDPLLGPEPLPSAPPPADGGPPAAPALPPPQAEGR